MYSWVGSASQLVCLNQIWPHNKKAFFCNVDRRGMIPLLASKMQKRLLPLKAVTKIIIIPYTILVSQQPTYGIYYIRIFMYTHMYICMYIRCLLVTIADSNPASNILEITEFLLNILASFFVHPLFFVSNLNLCWHILFLQPKKPFFKYLFTFTQQQLHQQTFEWINQTFHEICQNKN